MKIKIEDTQKCKEVVRKALEELHGVAISCRGSIAVPFDVIYAMEKFEIARRESGIGQNRWVGSVMDCISGEYKKSMNQEREICTKWKIKACSTGYFLVEMKEVRKPAYEQEHRLITLHPDLMSEVREGLYENWRKR